jgi:RHS repeat-associated protein
MNLLKTVKNGLIALTLATLAVAGFAAKTTITYIHTDHLGSPVLATKEDGTVKWREDYQPFGKQLTNEDTDNNIGFTGHRDDKGLGLTYMQARWYHPEVGRFMALDPILYRDVHSFNRYVYGNNNPFRFIDPDGKSAIESWFKEVFSADSKEMQQSSAGTEAVVTDMADTYKRAVSKEAVELVVNDIASGSRKAGDFLYEHSDAGTMSTILGLFPYWPT